MVIWKGAQTTNFIFFFITILYDMCGVFPLNWFRSFLYLFIQLLEHDAIEFICDNRKHIVFHYVVCASSPISIYHIGRGRHKLAKAEQVHQWKFSWLALWPEKLKMSFKIYKWFFDLMPNAQVHFYLSVYLYFYCSFSIFQKKKKQSVAIDSSFSTNETHPKMTIKHICIHKYTH